MVIVVVAVISVDLAILIVPTQAVHLYGQTVSLGAVRPTLSLSGPSHVVLFSQTLDFMPTVHFPGLVRPLASLTHLSTSPYLSQLTDGQHADAAKAAAGQARHAIVVGWLTYFGWIAAVAGLIAGTLALLIRRATMGHSLRAAVQQGGVATMVTLTLLGVNIAADYGTGHQTFTDPHLASRLFNHTDVTAPPPASGTDTTTQIAILGDSTEAGEGLPVVAKRYTPDWLCDRSPDAAATRLATTGLAVANLACSGATIESGLMGGQVRYGRTVSPQLSALEAMPDVKFIFVGIGADDVGWSDILKACVALVTCDNQATTAMFDQYLEQFARNYYQLLISLQDVNAKLKNPAAVVIDQYYDPFGSHSSCAEMKKAGWPALDATKIAFLRGLLGQLNSTLAEGAKAAGFSTTAIDFSGNQLCDAQSYVRGFDDKAPFHPNTLGQMQIAIDDLAALSPDWQADAADAR